MKNKKDKEPHKKNEKELNYVDQPNSKTWERIHDYRRDPMINHQLAILIKEEFDLTGNEAIFLVHSVKNDTELGRIFFEDGPNPDFAFRAAVQFGIKLGLIEKEEQCD